MFRYSPVEIYSACKPPLMLEFTNQSKKDWLDVELNVVCFYNLFLLSHIFLYLITYMHVDMVLFLKVHHKWKLLFSEIGNILQDLESRYPSQDMCKNTNNSVCRRLLLEVARMLAQEKNEVEVNIVLIFCHPIIFTFLAEENLEVFFIRFNISLPILGFSEGV
jgi:1-phosphatidylinositol-3-phosphate 5-kinase